MADTHYAGLTSTTYLRMCCIRAKLRLKVRSTPVSTRRYSTDRPLTWFRRSCSRILPSGAVPIGQRLKLCFERSFIAPLAARRCTRPTRRARSAATGTNLPASAATDSGLLLDQGGFGSGGREGGCG